MKIGVFVGSFNPVHKGHINIVNTLIEKEVLDKILIVATNGYWDKQNLINLEHRINMLSVYSSDKIVIDREHNNYEHTYQILSSLKDKYKDDEIHLIMGADQLPKFHLWKNIDKILENKIIVVNRNGIDISNYVNKFKNKDNFIIADVIEENEISSTSVRNGNTSYLDKEVLEYILKNNLYDLGGK